ncbi:MAG TPA: hypothetical protein VFN43_01895 [Humibacillus sp.]|nr:hypothetical protein [Humibacillus sp.]
MLPTATVAASSMSTGSTPRGSSLAPVGDSTMTPIPEALGCTTRNELGNRAPVRAEQLWPGASEIGTTAVEVRARPGVGGCRGALPASPDCDLSLPWAGMEAEDLARATGADIVVSGRAYAHLAASSDSSRGTASLAYFSLTFNSARDRLTATRAWFGSAVERCGLGGPGSMAGVSGFVGERHKPTLGPSDAGRFLLTSQGSQLVGLVFEGGAWSQTSREDVVRRVLPLLRAG